MVWIGFEIRWWLGVERDNGRGSGLVQVRGRGRHGAVVGQRFRWVLRFDSG